VLHVCAKRLDVVCGRPTGDRGRAQTGEDSPRDGRLTRREIDDCKLSSQLMKGADGHDWQRRRGTPIIGKGVSGAMPGTNPLGALLAQERGRRR